MRKTRIVCTMGPSTEKGDVLRQLVEHGMNIARFNFSHGDFEEHRGRYEALRRISAELSRPVAAMLDTKGPEIRLGVFKNGMEKLTAGQQFTLTSREIEGDDKAVSVTYKELPRDVSVGGWIMLDDGLIGLKIDQVTETDVICTVENDGVIKTHKGVNVPGVHLSMPYLSRKDREDILFGIRLGFDLVSASFTRNAQDILDIRKLIDEHHSGMRIIAKIENQEGVDNIDEILAAADGIMVARGDMGVEIDFTEIPAIQKRLIDRAMAAGKIVITATQMLDSMMINPRPTRAEITDVANAIYDGTTAVMLSGETAAGKYPVEALKVMSAIADSAENEADYYHLMHQIKGSGRRMSVNEATAYAAAKTAEHVGAAAIITVSQTGETARLISSCRPRTPIVACVMEESIQRRVNTFWGVKPLIMPRAHSTDEMIHMAVETVEKAGLIHTGDLVVVTAGVPVGVSGTTNMIKVHLIGK